MGNITFLYPSYQKAPSEFRIDPDGKVWVQAVAHGTVTAKTPYKVVPDEYGWKTAALTGDTGEYMIGVPAVTKTIGLLVWMQIGGYLEDMITASLSVSLGHGLYIYGGAVADSGQDYSGVFTEFAICAEASTTSTTQTVWLTMRKINSVIPRITAKTANYTCTAFDHGKIFTTTGAEAAVTFTLPAVASSTGLEFTFINTVDQNMVVSDGGNDTLVCFNDAAADSITFSTSSEKIGAALKVICDGTNWLVFSMCANTQTIATA